VVEAVVRDFESEMNAYLAGPAVVDAAPESRVDDLLAELVCSVKVVHSIANAWLDLASEAGQTRRSGLEDRSQADPNDVLHVELNKQTGDLVEIGTGGGRWRDNEKLANLSVQVFGSASDAHQLMAPLNAFSRGWGKVAGRITKDEEIDGLGDEAWRLWSEGNGTEVTYHWRRGNLFVEAHVDCFGYCPGNVDAATRAWVDAIDEAARTGS
jgi:hypothetical protein